MKTDKSETVLPPVYNGAKQKAAKSTAATERPGKEAEQPNLGADRHVLRNNGPNNGQHHQQYKALKLRDKNFKKMLDIVEEVEQVQKDFEGRGQILSNAAKHFADEDQVEKMKRANQRAIQGMSNTKQTKAYKGTPNS